MVPFVGNETMYVNFDKCYKFEVVNDKLKQTADEEFNCAGHLEADTKA